MEKLGFAGMIPSILQSLKEREKQGLRREQELGLLGKSFCIYFYFFFPMCCIFLCPQFFVSPSHFLSLPLPVTQLLLFISFTEKDPTSLQVLFAIIPNYENWFAPLRSSVLLRNKCGWRVRGAWCKYSRSQVNGGGKEVNSRHGCWAHLS